MKKEPDYTNISNKFWNERLEWYNANINNYNNLNPTERVKYNKIEREIEERGNEPLPYVEIPKKEKKPKPNNHNNPNSKSSIKRSASQTKQKEKFKTDRFNWYAENINNYENLNPTERVKYNKIKAEVETQLNITQPKTKEEIKNYTGIGVMSNSPNSKETVVIIENNGKGRPVKNKPKKLVIAAPLSPVQMEMYNLIKQEDKFYNVINCSRSLGKSYLMLILALEFALGASSITQLKQNNSRREKLREAEEVFSSFKIETEIDDPEQDEEDYPEPTLLELDDIKLDPFEVQELKNASNKILKKSGNATNILIVAPSYRHITELQHTLDQILGENKKHYVSSQNLATRIIEFYNGNRILFRSSGEETSVRGIHATVIFCDEYSYCHPGIWTALAPCLTRFGSKVYWFSTPAGTGLNNFYIQYLNCFKEGLKDQYLYIERDYTHGPKKSIKFIEEQRETMSPSFFSSEYLCQFQDFTDGVFGDFKKCATVEEYRKNIDHVPCYCGIDIGTSHDYTVLTIINSFGVVVECFNVKHNSYEAIAKILLDKLQEYPEIEGYIETNNQGMGIYLALKEWIPGIKPWITTNLNKTNLINNLILVFNKKSIAIPTEQLNSTLHYELSNFQEKRSPQTSKITYSARGSGHDDTVMSLGLAAMYWYEECRYTSDSFSLLDKNDENTGYIMIGNYFDDVPIWEQDFDSPEYYKNII